jgi:hypothetical protein
VGIPKGKMMHEKIIKQFTLALSTTIMIGCGGAGGTTTTPSNNTYHDSNNITSLNTQSNIKKLATDKEGKITTIVTDGKASGVAISKETLFVSEGENGVEIIRIGYNDKISTEILSKIEGINAQSVILSKDAKKLYIEDAEGYMVIYDVSDLSHPIMIGKTTKQKIDNAAISKNGTYKYIPRGEEGFEILSIANPADTEKVSTYTISNAYDIVLVDDDKKALIATGAVGINLVDLSNPTHVATLANYRVKGSSIMGLSLNESDEILFVATGDKGVLVFNLEILMHKLGY